jgi:hypothetical protein
LYEFLFASKSNFKALGFFNFFLNFVDLVS